MPSERLSVVVTRRLPDAVETRIKELFDVKLRDDDTPMTRSELAEAMKTADILTSLPRANGASWCLTLRVF